MLRAYCRLARNFLYHAPLEEIQAEGFRKGESARAMSLHHAAVSGNCP